MPKTRTNLWMAVAVAVALALTCAVLKFRGLGEDGLNLALRATARWSFVLFWPAYAGAALAQLFAPHFRALAARWRDFGLAFAAAQLVHLGLVIWLFNIARRPPVNTSGIVFFGVGIVFTYLLALLSIPRLSAELPARVPRVLRTIGSEYIGVAFLYDFAVNFFGVSRANLLEYLPFIVLAAIGLLLRLAARFIRSPSAPRVPSAPAPHREPASPRA